MRRARCEAHMHRIAFRDEGQAIALQLEQAVAAYDAHDAAVAQILDALDARRKSGVRDAKVVRPHAERNLARRWRNRRERQRVTVERDAIAFPHARHEIHRWRADEGCDIDGVRPGEYFAR